MAMPEGKEARERETQEMIAAAKKRIKVMEMHDLSVIAAGIANTCVPQTAVECARRAIEVYRELHKQWAKP